MKGSLTLVMHTFYGKMCFFSYCLREHRTSSYIAPARASLNNFCRADRAIPPYLAVMAGWGSQVDLERVRSGSIRRPLSTVVASKDTAHGRKAARPCVHPDAGLLIPPGCIGQGGKGIDEDALHAHFSCTGLCSQLSKIPCSKKCKKWSTAKSVAWYKLGCADVDGVTWQNFGSPCACP